METVRQDLCVEYSTGFDLNPIYLRFVVLNSVVMSNWPPTAKFAVTYAIFIFGTPTSHWRGGYRLGDTRQARVIDQIVFHHTSRRILYIKTVY
jgi:hypothetical protein